MVIIMDASTGKIEKPDDYGDEVRNASRVPRLNLGLQLQPAVRAKLQPPLPAAVPEPFLNKMYRGQS